ncbi:c-type cytochrome [Silvanigrella paludirubra]|uniref:C-type cytochrome n=1 Tax=Silvanigrella paludirubra TaxID=2499159 RepID=A0A6N6VXY4_9BACT|nr:c-type cytochrome [Silvanigrella paludirubra]KAB8039626.1 c-type cytochrome [Silvanigrella paludirubra]
MKAPARILIVSTLITLFVVFIVLYRYDLLKFNKGSNETIAENAAAPVVMESEVANAAPPKGPSAEQLANGKKLYEQATCTLCHGPTGKADNPTGQAMKATNLTTGQFKHNKNNLPAVKYIAKVIEEGVAGTGMASFKTQVPNEKDRLDLAEYVHSLAGKK